MASYLPEHEQHSFAHQLEHKLEQRISNCWFPQEPEKGSSFRAIKIFDRIDPILKMEHSYFSLSMLPNDFILWVDPKEVSFRQGTNYVNTIWAEDRSDSNSDAELKIAKKSPKVTISRPRNTSKKQTKIMSRLPIQASA